MLRVAEESSNFCFLYMTKDLMPCFDPRQLAFQTIDIHILKQ
jgi:hypothetical protein